MDLGYATKTKASPGRARHKAMALGEQGRHAEAAAVWRRLHALQPWDTGVVASLAEAWIDAKQPQAALDLLARQRHGDDPRLLRLLGRAMLALRLRPAGVGALFEALRLDPENADTLGLLASGLGDDGQAAMALPYAEAAFRLRPDASHATTLSCILIDLGRDEEALAVTGQGLAVGPGVPELLLNRAIALEGLDRVSEALEVGRLAWAAAPGNAFSQYHLAATMLASGAMTAEAWSLYEARLHLNGPSVIPRHALCWTGGDVRGKTVLLHAEQGLGDTLQFVRYAPAVAALGARVVLAVQPSLVRLLQGTPGADAVVPVDGTLPAFDVYLPLLSVPRVLRTVVETIPPPLRYRVPRRAAPDERLQVGLAWAGNPGFVLDRKRSVPAARLAPLAGVAGVAFHSLQLGAGEVPGIVFASTLDGIKDMADTAGRVAGLDLVVAVDTAVAHLAATMGTPVWLLSRFRGCWRWLRGREDSPWYPSLRVLRQERPEDWEGVIARVVAELEGLAGEHGAR